MIFICKQKLSLAVLLIALFGVIATQAQSKKTNEQNQKKGDQKDSLVVSSEKHKSRGYYNVTSLEVLNFDFNYLKPVSLSPVPGISTINGYRFSRNVSLGLGVGFDYIGVWLPVYIFPKGSNTGSGEAVYYKEEMSFIPVFIDFRLNLSNTLVTPYMFVDAGYDISLNPNKTVFVDTENLDWYVGVSSTIHNFSGAFYSALGFGLKFPVYKNIGINTAIKITYRGIKYTDDINNRSEGRPFEWFYSTTTQSVYNSLFLLGLLIGVSF